MMAQGDAGRSMLKSRSALRTLAKNRTNSPSPSSRQGRLFSPFGRISVFSCEAAISFFDQLNSIPSIHMRCRMTASLRATATNISTHTSRPRKRCRIEVGDRFWINRYGPSRRHAQKASAALSIFVRHPKRTFATISAVSGHRQAVSACPKCAPIAGSHGFCTGAVHTCRITAEPSRNFRDPR